MDNWYLNLSKKNIIIINSQSSYEEGKHWLLLSIDPPKKIIFFDSIAKTPDYYSKSLSEYLGADIRQAAYRIQGASNVCGIYCIAVAHLLCVGKNLTSIIDKFSPYKLENNDAVIIDWISHQPYADLLTADCLSELEPCLAYR